MGHLFSEAPHNIVILRALQLGDLLCSVPAFRALRAALPKARITLIGLPWAASFVQRFSHYLDDFIEFPGWPGLPEREPQIHTIPAFLRTVQERKYDLAIQMQGSGLITNSLVSLFGAKQTAGFYPAEQYRPNDNLFCLYPENEPEIRIFLQLMKFLGVPNQGEHLEFPLSTQDWLTYEIFRSAHKLQAGRYVCLHPGARFNGRRLPPELFAAAGDALAKMGYRTVLTGTEAERELTAAVASQMLSPALDAAGKTDLGALALLLTNARLLISNDTGVSHIAAAFQTPSVILFTASDPNRWRPLNHHLHRIVQIAMDDKSADFKIGDVIEQAKYLLTEIPFQPGEERALAHTRVPVDTHAQWHM